MEVPSNLAATGFKTCGTTKLSPFPIVRGNRKKVEVRLAKDWRIANSRKREFANSIRSKTKCQKSKSTTPNDSPFSRCFIKK